MKDVSVLGSTEEYARDQHLHTVFIPDMPVTVPYLQGLGDVFFQQDDSRPHVSLRISTYFDTKVARLFPSPARSPDLSLIETI
ncbi:hypothetical protein TNCV_2325871 [Trichonephila clavipes]|nr:hypothetical protein TNCV_2325871 [Trichonephila clavipes]